MADTTPVKVEFKPLSNLVLIQPEARKEQTESGILLPENNKIRPSQGIVVAVGDGLLTANGEKIKMKVKLRDIVMFPQFAGTELEIGKVKFLIMRESDLYGILTYIENNEASSTTG